MSLQDQVLDILKRDARTTPAEIAVMVGEEEAKVAALIRRLEETGVILGYKTIINPEQTTEDKVGCLIEVSVQPQRGHGFDKTAERIYRFQEVQSVFLVSGTYDLLVVIEGRNLKEVANFVIEKLSVLPNVRSTTSHFLLKKYKEMGNILVEQRERERIPVSS